MEKCGSEEKAWIWNETFGSRFRHVQNDNEWLRILKYERNNFIEITMFRFKILDRGFDDIVENEEQRDRIT